MKKLYFIFATTLIMLMGNSLISYAQAPEGFTYQAEARDAAGKLLVNKSLIVRTTILVGSATGGDVWDKNYNVTTDKYGLFSIVVGDAGTETSFSQIEWGEGKYYLNVQIKNGTTWINTGTTQLLSVPYALFAKSAGSAKITEADPVFKGSSWYSTTNNSSNWNTAYNWGDHASAGYLKSFTETDPVFSLSPAYGITFSQIDNWNTAFGWGDHAGLYRPVDWVPAWTDITGKPFRFDSPLNGDILKYDGGIDRWINWTPNFLTTETDPVVKAINGLVKSDGAVISAAVAGTDYLAPGQAVTGVTGTGPIVSTGGITPAISINPATTSSAGSMSAADKTKLNGIDGSETKLSAGTNVTITGSGTAASPYVVNATGATTLSIGQSYQGGIIFWLDATGQHGLIAATADQSTGIQWHNGTYRYTGTTGDGLYSGSINTAMIVATQIADNQTGNFAAKVCADYSVTVGGVTYGDWYLPSKYELNLLYLQKNAVGGFASASFYWSSSESSNYQAWIQFLDDGYQETNLKYLTHRIRAIRSF